MSKLNFNAVQATKTQKAPQPRQPISAASKTVTTNARTENGAVAYSTTGNQLTDFFSSFGGMRQSPEASIIKEFLDLFNILPNEATKLLVFFRDCRGGEGERRVFDVVYGYLIKTNHPLAYQLLTFVPEFGYWKDVRDYMVSAVQLGNNDFLEYASLLYASRLKNDTTAKNMSLAAKYAPTENWAKKNSTNKIVWVRFFHAVKEVGLAQDFEEYRKLISLMRSTLGVTERTMSDREWQNIDFSKVPSKAHALYRKAFGKHQQERYAAYLESVKKGDKKINAGVLTPYDVIKRYITTQGNVYKYDETLEQLWKALPNYVNHDVLAISDTSSSMDGDPMLMSIALGVYFAQRSTGAFKNEVISFNSDPEFVDLSKANTLYDALQIMGNIDWGGSTDLNAVFTKILATAKANKATQEDMPKFLLIISDMQFNRACGMPPFQQIKNDFEKNGYQIPQVIFWDVRRSEQSGKPSFDEFGVMQVSGSSPAVLQYVLSTLGSNTMEIVQRVLDNPRYAFVDDLEFFKM